MSRKISISVGTLVFFISVGMGLSSIAAAMRIVGGMAEQSVLMQAGTGAKLVRETIFSQLAILQEIANRTSASPKDWAAQRESLRADAVRHGYLDMGLVAPDGFTRYALEDPSLLPLAKVVAAMREGRAGTGGYSMGGASIVTGYSPVADLDWILAVTAEKRELLKGVAGLRNIVIIGTLLFLATGILVALAIGQAIARPLSAMLPVLQSISEGDLRVRRLPSSPRPPPSRRWSRTSSRWLASCGRTPAPWTSS